MSSDYVFCPKEEGYVHVRPYSIYYCYTGYVFSLVLVIATKFKFSSVVHAPKMFPMGDKLGDDGGRRNRKLFPETCLATFNSADLNLETASEL
jgi:hypothetical protein